MSFEQDIIKTPQDRIDFEALCKSTFNCPSGRALLRILCHARHPMDQTPGRSDHYRGNCEVVAALWRYGSEEFSPPEMVDKPNKPTQ